MPKCRIEPLLFQLDQTYTVLLSIPREGQTAIDTGIGTVIPPTHQGHIYFKSKLACERSLHVGAGVVDPDYTGPIFVVLCNPTKKDELIKQGEAVAQIVCSSHLCGN